MGRYAEDHEGIGSVDPIVEPFLIDVALSLPSTHTFQYSVPESLKDKVSLGKQVGVRIRSRLVPGYVVSFSDKKEVEDIKEIESATEEAPVLTAEYLALTRWMSEHYFCSWGQAIEAGLPAPFRKGKFLIRTRSGKATDGAENVDPHDLVLTAEQSSAFKKIFPKITSGENASFLIHGITGSGKTEIYMHLIRETLKIGRGAIVLVPEISLTPQTVDRFYSRFGEGVAVMHSRLSAGRRLGEWNRIRSREARVVVGARSAIFSPVPDLGLIVIDEEQDTSYKQEETPRYQTREVAQKRAEIEQAVLVLGSATPSLEAYFESETGKIERLCLSERIEQRPLPSVQIIDMRRQGQFDKRERVYSSPLEEAIRNSLARKEQVILLLNRRGFSTYLHCSSCGYVMTCENCRIALAYHYDKASLYCHVCHFRTPPAKICPSCQKHYIHYFGIGTQKVESEAFRLFPGARIARMDRDSTAKKDSHELILRAFRRREIDILIGTQMIAKGHDFPNVSLIGVISADTALHLPDFRAAERTFGLLTQVAGRAGRGDIPGKVIIQSYVPGHYAIQSAMSHDYLGFYAKEIHFRKELQMPPYAHLIQLVLSGSNEKEVVRQVLLLARAIQAAAEGLPKVKTLGPAPCLSSKEKNQFRWNLYLKGPDPETALATLKKALSAFKKTGTLLTVNVDPQ